MYNTGTYLDISVSKNTTGCALQATTGDENAMIHKREGVVGGASPPNQYKAGAFRKHSINLLNEEECRPGTCIFVVEANQVGVR